MKELRVAVREYLLSCQYEKNLSKHTIKAYRQDLSQFIILLEKRSYVQEIGKDAIRIFVRSLFELKLKATSIRRKIASVKAFLRYLEFEDEIPVSPFRKMNVHIKVPRQTPRYLSLTVVQQLIASAHSKRREHTSTSRRQFTAIQEVVIIELLFSTGIRVSELCGLNIDHVDLTKRTITVSGKGSRERTALITHQGIFDLLSQFIEKRTSRVALTESLLINRYGNRMLPHSVRVILRRIAHDAKLSTKVTPHLFRHAVATLLLENGVDIRFVQKFLGHSSITTTQMYTHLSTSAERDMLASKHPRNLI